MSREFYMQVIVVALTALTVCPTLSGELQQGRIVGKVVNESGSPVGNAQVTPQFLGPAVMRTLVQKVNSDADGNFRIEGLEWGPYAVYAGKEAEGYPDTRVPLYRSRPASRVELSPEHPVRELTVTIGPKGGVLVGSVRDQMGNTPLPVQLILQKKDGSGLLYLSEPPDFQALLPANTDVLIEIHAPGYKPWSYGKESKRTLRLSSGEQIKVDIELHRLEMASPKT